MKKIFTVLVLFIFILKGYGQQCLTGNCLNFVNQYPSGIFTPTTSWQTLSAMNGGNWTLFNVVCGNTYDFTYCEAYGGGVSTNFDAQLTLYNYETGTQLCFSDDNCGTTGKGPFIRWTSNFTGRVRLLTSAYVSTNCQNSSNSGPYNKMAYRVFSTPASTVFITVYNVSGAAWGNAKVVLYNSNFSQILGTAFTNNLGQVSFNVNNGSYNYEVYYTPGGTNPPITPFQEFWGSASFSICSGGQSIPLTFNRNQPYLASSPSFSPSSLSIGQSGFGSFSVRSALSYSTSSYVVIWTDRNQSSPFDFQKTTTSQTISVNSPTNFSTTIAPTNTGTHYSYVFVYSLVNGSYIITDQFPWISSFAVTCPSYSSPTSPSPGLPIGPGPQLTTDQPTFTWSGVSSGVYHIQIWDATTTNPNNTNVIYGFQTSLNSPGHCISGLFHTIPQGVLTPNGYYKWRVHRNDPCGECESSPTSMMYFQAFSGCSPPNITSQPSPQSTICNNQIVTLSIGAQGTNISYQWQQNSGSNWNQVGSNSSAYSTNIAGTYRCVVSSQCGVPEISQQAIVYNGGTCTGPIAQFSASPTIITAGQTVNFTNQSLNAIGVSWDIQRVQSNGNSISFYATTQNNFSLAFTSAGCYKIQLTAYNGANSNTATSSNCYIKVNANLSNQVPENVSYNKKYPTGKGGDPVILSSGCYDISFKDLSVSGIKTEVEIERRYLSRNTEMGIFGKGWFFDYSTWIDFSNPYEWQVHHGDGHVSYHIPFQDGETRSLYQGMFDTLYYAANSGNYTYTYQEKNGVKWIYENSGKLISKTDLDGNAIQCIYTGNNLTSITAPGGRYINLFYNAYGRVITAVASGGKQATYYYNINGELLDSVKIGTSTTGFRYGPYGMTEVYDPKGNRVILNDYNSSGQVTKQWDALNNLTTFNYNTPAALQTTVVNPLLKNKVAKHDNNYHLIESIDELNNKRKYSFNQSGLIDTLINELNSKKKFQYDANNNIKKAIDEKNYFDSTSYGNFSRPTYLKDKEGNATSITYNANGNPISIILPNSGVIQTFYNANGQDTLIIDARSNSTRKQYYPNGDIYKIITPTSVNTFNYDGQGKATSVVNGNGNVTSFEYNYYDQVTKITDPMGYFTLFEYDLNGNLISFTDKEGNVTQRQYDAKDRLIKIIEPNNHNTSFYYDVLDRPVKIRDANGNAKLFTYDDDSRLLTVADSILGTLSSYTYDNAGNIKTLTDGRGKIWTTIYDERSMPVAFINPLNKQKTVAYNKNGQIIQSVDEMGRITQWTYNSLSLPSIVTDVYGKTVQHFYDLNGNIDSIIDALGNRHRWTYDAADRKKTTDEGYGVHLLDWDSAGNLIKYTDPNNKATEFLYNPNNENISQKYDGTTLKSFLLSKNGWIKEASNNTGIIKFERDVYGRTIQKIGIYNDTVNYKRDSVGNITELDYGYGRKLTYTYNSLDQSLSVTDWHSSNYQIYRNNSGSIDSIIYPNGARIRIARDNAGRIKTWKNYLNASPNSLLVMDSLVRDDVGNILANPSYKLLYPTISDESNNGKFATADRITNYGKTSFQSGNNGNITSATNTPITNTYNYESNGNNINGNVKSYLLNGIQQTNSFDAFNNRVAIENKATYSIDEDLDGRPVTLSEMDYNSHLPIASNIYSPEGMLLARDSSGIMLYPMPDVNGNIVALLNSTATVTDTYATDLFGDYFTHTGTSNQPFGFLGMYGVQRDSSGLYYDWARYYDSHIGRFLSKDPYSANTLQTQGVNAFGYGMNNPLSYFDVNGLKPINVTNVNLIGKNRIADLNNFIDFGDEINTNVNILGSSFQKAGKTRVGSNGILYLEKASGRVFNGNLSVVTKPLKNIGKTINKVTGNIGGLINLYQLADAYSKDNYSIGKNTTIAASGIAGSILGTEIGLYIGGAIGSVFGGIGAVPGAAIGGFVGSYFGNKIGEIIGQKVSNLVY